MSRRRLLLAEEAAQRRKLAGYPRRLPRLRCGACGIWVIGSRDRPPGLCPCGGPLRVVDLPGALPASRINLDYPHMRGMRRRPW